MLMIKKRLAKKQKVLINLIYAFYTLFNMKKLLMLADTVLNETHLQSPDFVNDDIDT